MERQEWNKICSKVTEQMGEYIKKFVTPISYELPDHSGEHHGSGSYFSFNGKNYLITNEHVANYLNKYSLTHKFKDSENIFKIINPIVSLKAPIDVAICQIADEVWTSTKHSSLTIPFDCFSETHNTVEHELLFLIGFSGQRSSFYFNYMSTNGTPYLTQKMEEISQIKEYDAKYHFALPYPADKATSIDNTSSLPDPHGFSGSLVWDTKVVACMKEGKEWSPDQARVTGIVWGWPSSNACLLATKVEHFNIKELANLIEELKP